MADDEKFRVSLTFDTNDAEGNVIRLQNLLAKLVLATQGEDAALKNLQNSLNRYVQTATGAAAATDKNAKAADRLAQSDNLVARAAAGQASAVEQLGRAQGQAIEMNKRFDEQNRKNANSTRNVGYELLVVGGIITTVGQKLLGFAKLALGAGIEYERAFANVVRTASDGSISIDRLRSSLIELTTQIPESFANITEIASLGGQLGIAGTGIKDFTSVVARLTATTDLTAEAAGTALGRFQALLGLPSDKFENLASAILKVGVNSVATESQIVAISTQISSMADFAGFTADQVVGLAGALASVGAAPELSRGTITRTFALISKAIASGSEKLDEFARISGVSSEDFAAAFGTARFAGVFQSFLANLGKMQDEGKNTVITLNSLGITSVRDVPLLLRLAGATDTVTKTFADAASGFRDATELNKQYGIIASTTASRIQLLVNNVQNFLATIGGSATGPLSDFVDILSEAVKALTAFLSTDAGQHVAFIGLAVSALVGVLFTLVGAVTFAAGTFLLLRNAADALGFSSTALGAKMNLSTLSLTTMSTAARGALAALNPLLIAVTAISLVLGHTDDIQSFAQGLYGIDSSASAADKRLNSLQSTVKAFDVNKLVKDAALPFLNPIGFTTDQKSLADLKNIGKEMANIVSLNRSVGAAAGFGDFAKVDESIAALVKSGNIVEARKRFDELKATADKLGVNKDIFNAAFPDAINSFKGLSAETEAAAQKQYDFAESEDAAAAATEALATKLLVTPEALKSLGDALVKGSSSFFSFGDIINDLASRQEELARQTAVDSGDSADNWKEYSDSSITSLDNFAAGLQGQVDAQKAWADNLRILAARGATGFVTELAKLGPAGAGVAAQAVDATTEQLNQLEINSQLAGFLSSQAFADAFTAGTPDLIAAYKLGGVEAVRGLIAEQVNGAPGAVSQMVSAYNKQLAQNKLKIYANTQPATDAVNAFLNNVANSGASPFIGAGAGAGSGGNVMRYAAAGGLMRGPGTGTSDSIRARLSDGEYVIRAASVRRYGTGLFDQLNRGVAKFASGGQVGAAPRTPSAVPQLQLSPRDRMALRGSSGNQTIQLVVDGRVLASVVNNENANNQFTGAS